MKDELFSRKTVTTALTGAAFGVAMGASPTFAAADLSQGYQNGAPSMQLAEGRCGEGRCGGAMGQGREHADEQRQGRGAEGRCGEGRCGEGRCGADMKDAEEKPKGHGQGRDSERHSGEGRCGEGRCGGAR